MLSFATERKEEATENVETNQAIKKKLYPDCEKTLRVKRDDTITLEALTFIDEYGRMLETVYDDKVKKTMFALIADGEAIVTPSYLLNRNGQSYEVLPTQPDDAISKKAVLFAEKAEDFGSVAGLIEEIRVHIHKYLDVSPDYEVFAAYYILMTWTYEKIGNVPYLRAMGDTGCGKSRFLDVIGRLCFRAIMASGAVTPAPIYRLIEKWGGSLILDEADFDKDSSEKNEVVKILNCGFEKNRPIIRCNPNDVSAVEFHEAFCPKVLATRFPFFDKALESRCLTQVMSQTARNIPVQLTKKFYDEEMHLRNKLLMFRLQYYNEIDSEKVLENELVGVEPRLRQVTSSFSVLFANIPEVWCKFQAFMTHYNDKLIEERADSMTGYTVVAMFALLKEGKMEISAKDIVGKILEQQGFEPNSRTVGKQIKILGFETENVRVEGKRAHFINFSGKTEMLSSLLDRYFTADEREEYSTCIIDVVKEKQTKLEHVEHVEHVYRGEHKNMFQHENVMNGTCDIPSPHAHEPNVPYVPQQEESQKLTPQFVASELREMQETYKLDSVDEGEVREHFGMFGNTEEVNAAIEKAQSEGLIFRPKPNTLRVV